MITRIVKISIKQQNQNDFKNYINEVRPIMADFKGCEHIEILKDKSNSNTFSIYSIWKNEKLLEHFRSSEMSGEFNRTIEKWLEKQIQAWTVENV